MCLTMMKQDMILLLHYNQNTVGVLPPVITVTEMRKQYGMIMWTSMLLTSKTIMNLLLP